MPKGRRLGAEQIVTKLRQIEVLQGQGKNIAAACKEIGTTEQTQGRVPSVIGAWASSTKPFDTGWDHASVLGRKAPHNGIRR